MNPAVLVELAALTGIAAAAQQGAQAFPEHQAADGPQEDHVDKVNDQIDLAQLLEDTEDHNADGRSEQAARQQHQSHQEVDVAPLPMGEHAGNRRGHHLVRLRRDGDRRRHADEQQQRRHEKTTADTEETG